MPDPLRDKPHIAWVFLGFAKKTCPECNTYIRIYDDGKQRYGLCQTGHPAPVTSKPGKRPPKEGSND